MNERFAPQGTVIGHQDGMYYDDSSPAYVTDTPPAIGSGYQPDADSIKVVGREYGLPGNVIGASNQAGDLLLDTGVRSDQATHYTYTPHGVIGVDPNIGFVQVNRPKATLIAESGQRVTRGQRVRAAIGYAIFSAAHCLAP